MKLRRSAAGLLACLLPAGWAGAEEPAKGKNFADTVLQQLVLGKGIQTDQLILFPLLLAQEPAPLEVGSALDGTTFSVHEPEFPSHRYDLMVGNAGKEPLLLPGGTILEGGERDRLVLGDALIPPGGDLEISTLPASAASDIRDEAIPFRITPGLACSFLRERAAFGASSGLVPTFVTHFLEFRNEADTRNSLAAIHESRHLAQFCIPCHRTLESFPKPKEEGFVVGAVVVIRGRVQAVEVFGTNALLQAFFVSLLQGHSFPAAALELRAKKAGIPLPGKDDPTQTLEVAGITAKRLMDRLRAASWKKDPVAEGDPGEAFLFRANDGTRGRAIGLGGRLVHLTAFPHDPFEDALYSKTLDPGEAPKTDDDESVGVAELTRGNLPGRRLTEEEQRLLDRLRQPPPFGGTGGLPRR